MTPPGQRLRSDLVLLLAALLWGSAFVPQRLAAGHLGFFLFNGLRFLLGAAVLLPWALRRKPLSIYKWAGIPFPGKGQDNGVNSVLRSWTLIAGVLLAAASACQQAGLKYTTAGNAGFITGLYVIFVPVVLLMIWRQKVAWRSWAGAGIATLGVFLLSVDDRFQLGFGDTLELAGAVLYAFHVVIIGRAVRQVDFLLFSAGQYLVAGSLSVLIGLVLEANTLPGLADCWWAVVYVGVFSVAAGYTLQALAQRHAPPADAAIILSMEAVFAALFGYLILNERLGIRQLAGCAMILAAVAIVQKSDGN